MRSLYVSSILSTTVFWLLVLVSLGYLPLPPQLESGVVLLLWSATIPEPTARFLYNELGPFSLLATGIATAIILSSILALAWPTRDRVKALLIHWLLIAITITLAAFV